MNNINTTLENMTVFAADAARYKKAFNAEAKKRKQANRATLATLQVHYTEAETKLNGILEAISRLLLKPVPADTWEAIQHLFVIEGNNVFMKVPGRRKPIKVYGVTNITIA